MTNYRVAFTRTLLVAACLATLHGVASAAQVAHQAGAGSVQDVSMVAGKIAAATDSGFKLYEPATLTRIALSEGFDASRSRCVGDTCVVSLRGVWTGASTFDVAGGTRIDSLGFVPGNFSSGAVAVSSHEAGIYGVELLTGTTAALRVYSRAGGGFVLSVPIGPTSDLVACGGTSASPAGSRLYAAVGNRVQSFDGVTLAAGATSIDLGASVNRLVCDGADVWVATQTRAVRLRGTDLAVLREVPVPGRTGFALIGTQLWGVLNSVVRGYDVSTSTAVGSWTRSGTKGVTGLGDGRIITGNANPDLTRGIYVDTVGTPGPVTVPPTAPSTQPPAASATRTATGTTQPTVVPTATRTGAVNAPPTCPAGCVVGGCGQ